jgi:hypothetical protein
MGVGVGVGVGVSFIKYNKVDRHHLSNCVCHEGFSNRAMLSPQFDAPAAQYSRTCLYSTQSLAH